MLLAKMFLPGGGGIKAALCRFDPEKFTMCLGSFSSLSFNVNVYEASL